MMNEIDLIPVLWMLMPVDGSTFLVEGQTGSFPFFRFQGVEDVAPVVTIQSGMIVEDDGGGKHDAVVFADEHRKGPLVETFFDGLFPIRTGVLTGNEFSIPDP